MVDPGVLNLGHPVALLSPVPFALGHEACHRQGVVLGSRHLPVLFGEVGNPTGAVTSR